MPIEIKCLINSEDRGGRGGPEGTKENYLNQKLQYHLLLSILSSKQNPHPKLPPPPTHSCANILDSDIPTQTNKPSLSLSRLLYFQRDLSSSRVHLIPSSEQHCKICVMGSFPTPVNRISSHLLETSCGYLLQELKIIWDEVGQDQLEREKVLFELEEECLEAYRRKVDNANISRARLHQALADSEAEFTHLLVTLGERSLPKRPEKMVGTLKEQLDSITPALREMQLRKEERVKQFQHVQMQIQKITSEIVGPAELDSSEVIINENDLSLKKLEEYQNELQRLQKEKSDRLLQVEVYIAAIYNLSATLGKDSSEIITKVHPSLDGSQGKQSKNISDDILTRLNSTMESLQEEKQKRLEKLERLGKELTNLWSLMDTPYEDRRLYSHLTDVISTSVAEISKPGSLAIEIILQAEAEVQRLDQLKASKMQELFLKKQRELEEICKKTHMEMPSPSEMDNIMDLIKSGKIDHADLLTTMDEQISRARAEASSRNGIMEKVEKWMQLRDEEHWLDEYNMDENRYSVSRGAHKNLRRAERARITVNKLPALMDSLMEKTRSWEEEHEKTFLYDEVPLLAMLEEYAVSKREKEEEKQRQREKKKVQVQGVVEQDRYSSRPSTSSSRPSTSSHRLPSKTINGGFGNATPFNRRLSMGIQQLGSNSTSSPSQAISSMKETKKSRLRKSFLQHGHTFNITEDTASVVSATYS